MRCRFLLPFLFFSLIFSLAACSDNDLWQFVQETGYSSNGSSSSSTSSSSTTVTSWWNADWQKRRKLKFDNSTTPENLNDFPVLVRLTGSRIDYGSTLAGGADLRFVACDNNTVLAHEVEQWVVGGESIIWVKVPSLSAYSTEEHIYMYYHNPAAPDGQNPGAVWSNGYDGVWHLNEASGDFADATPNNQAGEAFGGTLTRGTPGVVGNSVVFDGVSYIALHMEYVASFMIPEVTISVWFKTSFVGAIWDMSMAFVSFDYDNFYSFYIRGVDAKLGFSSYGGAIHHMSGDTAALDDNAWHHAVAVYSNGDKYLYLDGGSNGVEINAHGNPLGGPNLRAGFMGAESDANGFNGAHLVGYDGCLDEVRISNKARSLAWIKTQHRSQTDTFITYGAEESR